MGVVTGALGAYQMVDGIINKDAGKRGIKNYDRQDLTNAYENTQISTMGTRYLGEESSRANASLINAARSGGIRGIMGGLPQIVEANNASNQEGRLYLDAQVQNRTNNIAQEEMRLRAMRERRDESNLAALSSQVQTGRQDMWSGMMGMAKAGRYAQQNGEFPFKPVEFDLG